MHCLTWFVITRWPPREIVIIHERAKQRKVVVLYFRNEGVNRICLAGLGYLEPGVTSKYFQAWRQRDRLVELLLF
jgi:hypothetical protein